jgi:hypothetical protein
MIRILSLLFSLSLASALFAQTADLTLFRGEDAGMARLRIAMYNYGNAPARNVQITVDYPDPVTITSVLGDANQCHFTERPLRCVWDVVPQNAEARSLIVDFHAPPADAVYVITARATSDTPEENPANNSVSYTFETRVDADLRTTIQPSPVRLDPGATQVFNVEVLNRQWTLPPGDLLLKLTTSPGMTIESIESELWSCTIDGGTAECRASALDQDCFCGRDIRVTARASSDRGGGPGWLEGTVTSNLPDPESRNNTARATLQVYRHLVVSTNADAGEGSLRSAIETANQTCAGAPCRIVFEMPSESLQTITPASALPAVTADRVAIDGGGKITLDGTAAHSGLQMFSKHESIVQGLTFRNFGDQGLWVRAAYASPRDFLDQRRVSGNRFTNNFRGLRLDGAYGTLVEDNVIEDNVRSGIWSWDGVGLRIFGNRIERNGASGVFLGPGVHSAEIESNTITEHPEMGIAIASEAKYVHIEKNVIRDNGGLPIDWGLDGMSRVDVDDSAIRSNAPVILSAVYDATTDRTKVTMVLFSFAIDNYPFWTIDLYADAVWIGGREIYGRPEPGPFVVELPGNLTGKVMTATSTRVHSIYLELYIGPSHTSEYSNAIRVR